jgi:hypothetical protein
VNGENKIEYFHSWENRKLDGQEIFEFLDKHTSLRDKIDFVGGVSGPGGFSSLRSGAAIVNAIATAKGILSHAVRADRWIGDFLKKERGGVPFVLNSFGDGVFFPKDSELIRISLSDAVFQFQKKEVFVELLPEEKKNQFARPAKITHMLTSKESLESLIECLEKEPGKNLFIPTYEVSAV